MEEDSEEELSITEQEAIAWVARRANTSGWNASDEDTFQQWLAESPVNVEAYVHAEETLGSMGEPGVFRSDEIIQLKDVAQEPSKPKKQRGYWISSFAAVAASIVLVAFIWSGADNSNFQTEVGERQQFTLPDGTRVELDALSGIEYEFDDEKRVVKLLAGAVVFDIADGERPFQVYASDFVIHDIGTVFSVRYRGRLENSSDLGSAVEVAVAEGIVDVRSRMSLQEMPIRLTEGQQSIFSDDEPDPVIQSMRANSFASWRENRLRYRDRPLGEVLGDLERNFSGEIILVDSSLAELEVTGTLRSNELRETIALLEDILPIRVREFSEEHLIIDRRL